MSPSSRWKTAPRSSTSTWMRGCWTPRRPWCASLTSLPASRTSPGCPWWSTPPSGRCWRPVSSACRVSRWSTPSPWRRGWTSSSSRRNCCAATAPPSSWWRSTRWARRIPAPASSKSVSAPTASWWIRWASRRKTSSSTPTSSRWRPASTSTTTTRWTSSTRWRTSRMTCPTPWSPAASPTSPSRLGATSRCARPSTPSSSTTPSRTAWTWGSSTRASSPSMKTSRPSSKRRSRRWCSTGVTTPPKSCWPSPRSTAVPAPRPRIRGSRSGAAGRWASDSNTPWSRASPTLSRRTPKRRAPGPSGRCTSSRGRWWTAWTWWAICSAPARCSCPRWWSRPGWWSGRWPTCSPISRRKNRADPATAKSCWPPSRATCTTSARTSSAWCCSATTSR